MKKLLMLIIVGMFLISSVSALGFDNVKEYQTIDGITDKRVQVTNAFGFGDIIGYAEVDNNPRIAKSIFAGKDRETREWEITELQAEYIGGIGDVEFIDMKTGQVVQKEYKWMMRVYGWHNISIKKLIEYEMQFDTGVRTVESQVHDYYVQEYGIIDTVDYDSKNLPKGNITLVLVTDVKGGDWIDAIPTFMEEKLTRHAQWTADLNDHLRYYLNGSNGLDQSGNYAELIQLTTADAAGSFVVGGKVNMGMDFEEGGANGQGFQGVEVLVVDRCFSEAGAIGRSLALWIKPESDQGGDGYIIGEGQIAPAFSIQITAADVSILNFFNIFTGGTDHLTLPGASAVGEWTFIAATQDAANNSVTVNITRGTSFSQLIILAEDGASCSDVLELGGHLGSGSAFDGFVDEVGMWNITLTTAQVNQLYNEGNGLTHSVGPFEITPVVTILDPTNNTDYSTFQNSLNYSVTDGQRCWATNDSGIFNTSHVACGTNFTLGSIIGDNNWRVYANSSDGTQASEFINFSVTDAVPIVILNTPVDDFNSTGIVEFNCSAVDVNQVDNITLYIGTSLNQTKTIGATTGELNVTLLLADGYYNWTCNAYDNIGQVGWASNQSFTIDASKPFTAFVYPLDGSSNLDDFTTSNVKVTPINWTIADPNLDSCLLWNGTTNISLTCVDGFTWINVSYNVTYDFIIYANDTLGNSNSTGISATWNFNVKQNSQIFDSPVLETSNNYYVINLSSVGSEAVTAEFFVDGTSQGQGVKVGTNSEMTFNISADAGKLDTNEKANSTFWWLVSFGSTLINTTFTNQSILPLNIYNCNGTNFNASILNFTMKDQLTNNEINGSSNATDFEINFQYYAGSGNIVKNFSFSNLSSSHTQYDFCIAPWTASVTANVLADYDAIGYSPGSHTLTGATLSNITSLIDLLLLPDTNAVQFFITVKQNLEPLEGAVVTITKFFTGEGIYKTVGIKTTDSDGKFTEYLELDKQYRFHVLHNGNVFSAIDKSSICEAAPCSLTLELDIPLINIYGGIETVYAINVVSNLTYNSTSKIVTYEFIDITGLATSFNLIVSRSSMNQTGTTLCDKTVFSTAGTITCNISSYQGNAIAKSFVSRSMAKLDKVIRIGAKDLYKIIGKDMGLFVTIFMIITVALVGVWNPAVAIGMIIIGVWLGSSGMLGFAGYGMTTVIWVTIIGGIIIYKMKI